MGNFVAHAENVEQRRMKVSIAKLIRASVTSGVAVMCTATNAVASDASALTAEIDRLAKELEPKVIEWRRDIHQHPELSNREVRTGKLIAEHLQKLGIEVRMNVARTGVVGVLKGGKPGPVVALRADMDALPVIEQTDVPFASKVKGDVRRQGSRRDARLRPRHACGDVDGCSGNVRAHEGRSARHCQIHFPAR